MAKLIIRNLANRCILITMPDKSLLEHIQAEYIDWMHACGGKGRCTTCRVRVLEGMESISPFSAAEMKFKDQGRLKETERLTCQSYAYGDVVAEIPPECRLPHITYND
jgi:ferredoxin, 2Fe-2S